MRDIVVKHEKLRAAIGALLEASGSGGSQTLTGFLRLND